MPGSPHREVTSQEAETRETAGQQATGPQAEARDPAVRKSSVAGSDSTAVIVWVTAPAEVSAGLASAIIEKRIAACVQVVPGISSYFWWDNQVQQEGEHLLLIKTMRSSVAALKSLVTALHPYEVPELLVTAVQDGLDPYLAWIQETIAR
ncbi:uncharacterized protein involved in tolerance to divalent cations [Spirochaeta africana DSM 8902]|uniref:Uncharacterized protein involved in tolerance to divalent cations n=1 Tax=Spirochaeta africana (strain ATCC 700263 / DSM 8902 / Z-7692) TaxID=889378 RepID=H9UMU2_SPIAZ|nr:uncharacterized protein involved in tolerance to divalent cations [Spirochaeta africana DSM 8902]